MCELKFRRHAHLPGTLVSIVELWFRRGARKEAMQLAIWLTLSLFIGAFSAGLAAVEGGGVRDGTWSKTPFRAAAINR